MTLLRACSEAIFKPALLRPSLVLRTLSTEASQPGPTATKGPSEIAPIPQKDVLSADIISGAPGISLLSENRQYLIISIISSRAPSARRTYIPTYPEYDAERWSKGEPLAS
jgi:hypothetical protein